MARESDLYDLNLLQSCHLQERLELLYSQQKDFFVFSTINYSYAFYFILDHHFDCIYKLVNISDFLKNLNTTYKSSYSLSHLRLYYEVLSINFINIVFYYKLIFSLFIVSYFLQYGKLFYYPLIMLQYKSFLVMNFINRLVRNLSIFYLIVSNSIK